MSAEITQKLGFDTSDATKAIDAVNNSLTNFNKSLELNQKNLNKYVKNATKQLASLQAAAGTVGVGTGGAAKTTGGRKSPVAANAEEMKKALPTMQQYADMIRKSLGEVPEKASRRNKRAIQNSIGVMAEMAKKYKLSEKGITKAFANTDKAVTGHARHLTNAAQRINNNVSAAMKKAGGKIKEFTISWQTMGRVIMTQAIVRALSVLRNAIRAAIGTAIELGLRIAEIGTIAEGQLGSLAAINDEVVKMAKEFGRPVADVAEGLYQTISNQVGNATESLHVFRQANKLAIATNSTTADSVSLLTAALNGFGLSANHAERVAGVLFTTIKQGRLRASELANILGRVAPLFAQMGGSIEEMSAALATMTVTGVKADTAITQLRAIMIKLLKPSEDLKKVFQEEFGVENAQEALVMFGGLKGLLEELSRQTQGNTQEMSEFFDRVRAVAGVLGLTNVQAKKFTINLEKIIEEQDKALSGAFFKVVETNAKAAETAINNLKTEVTEFGAIILPIFTQFISGLTVLATDVKTTVFIISGALTGVLVPALYKVGAANLTAAASFGTLGAAGKAAWIAVLPPAAVIAGFAAGWWLGQKIIQDTTEEVQALRSQMEKLYTEEMEGVRKQAARIAEEWARGAGKSIQAAVKGLAQASKIQANELEQLKIRNEIEEDSTTRMLDRIISARQQVVDKLEKYVREAGAREEKRDKERLKITGQIEQRTFDNRLRNLSKEKQARELLDRSRTLAHKRTGKFERQVTTFRDKQGQLLGKTVSWQRKITKESLDQRQASLELATTEADRATQVARALGDKRLIRRAEAQQLTIMREQKDLLQERADLDAKLQKDAKEKAEAARKELADAKALQKIIVEGFKLSKDGKPKTLVEINASRDAALQAIDALSSSVDLELTDLLDLTGLQSQLLQLENQYKPTIQASLEFSAEEFKTKATQAMRAIGPDMQFLWIELMADILGEDNLPDLDFTNLPKQMQATMVQMGQKIKNELKRTKEQIAELAGGINAGFKSADVAIGKVRQGTSGTANIAGGDAKQIAEISKHWHKLTDALIDFDLIKQKVANDPEGYLRDPRNVIALQKLHSSILAERKWLQSMQKTDPLSRAFGKEGPRVVLFGKDGAANKILDPDLVAKNLKLAEDQVLTMYKTLFEARANAGDEVPFNADALTAKLQQIEELGVALEARLKGSADAGKSFSDNATNTVVPMQTMNQAAAGIAVSLGSAADSMQRISNLAGGAQAPTVPTQSRAKGGLIPRYFADGGFARKGTDTVPAMLTPGEYVVNARSTRKFYSQLVAMNAGKQPVYRSEGGPVTNVGDINISVTGGTTDRESARNIVTRVRRELRRRSSTLG